MADRYEAKHMGAGATSFREKLVVRRGVFALGALSAVIFAGGIALAMVNPGASVGLLAGGALIAPLALLSGVLRTRVTDRELVVDMGVMRTRVRLDNVEEAWLVTDQRASWGAKRGVGRIQYLVPGTEAVAIAVRKPNGKRVTITLSTHEPTRLLDALIGGPAAAPHRVRVAPDPAEPLSESESDVEVGAVARSKKTIE